MKMTPPLWRLVSVCLCVAALTRHSKHHVVCTESHQNAQTPESSPDVSSQEELGEKVHDHNGAIAFEENWMLLPNPPSESEQLIENRPATPEEDTKHSEASEADKGSSPVETETDQSCENPHPAPKQNAVSPSHDPHDLRPVSGFAAEPEDTPSGFNAQDDIPESVSEDAPQAADADPPPADCEEENNPYGSDSPPKVLENTSNVHTTGTKTLADPLSSSPDHSKHLEANASHRLKERDLSSPAAADTDSSASGKDPEDIPTFDEWKRKMMEVEKEKTQSGHTSNNGASHTAKKVQKNFNNYASVECGAKILGANPEAKSTSAILKENMDLYMLNPCSNKLWFIIELCEPVQVKQLDIANFELFSSSPKDFLVSISDRYPTNKWLKLGTFHARDERTVQSFPLDEHLYAKYVKMFTKYMKVELTSHFGSEHFCPLSLIRVFGTSMVEEYEEIADPPERPEDQDDDSDYPPGYAPGEVKLSKNLIGSAKDVILTMVNNIAVNVLGGANFSSSEANVTEPPPQAEPPTTDPPPAPESEQEQIPPVADSPVTVAPPLETPDADDSTEELPPVEEQIVIPLGGEEEEPIGSTITLLETEEDSDEERQQETRKCCWGARPLSSCSGAPSLLESLLRQCSAPLSRRRRCQPVSRKQTPPSIQNPDWDTPPPPGGRPASQQPPAEAPHEEQAASEAEPEPTVTSQPPGGAAEQPRRDPPPLEPSQTTSLPPSASDASSARPTPTVETPQLSSDGPGESQEVLGGETALKPSVPLGGAADVRPTAVDDPPVEPEQTGPPPPLNTPMETLGITDPPQVLRPTPSSDSSPPAVVAGGSSEGAPPPPDVTEPHPLITDTKLEDLVEDVSASSPPPVVPPPSPASPPLSDIYADPPNGTEPSGPPVHGSSQKESVFMRLNNRIKALEVNMSLSGRYLEQLSQRYRRQMEEMQKAFNKTIMKLQNTSRMAEEQDQRQTESIQSLQVQLENVTRLVLNLSVRVGHLQDEVSDRQTYLLLSLLLSLCLGLLLCANHCRLTSLAPAAGPRPPLAKSYTSCCPHSDFSCDDPPLKRSASYPLIHSDSLQLTSAAGPETLPPQDPRGLCPASRKRRRRRLRALDVVETLKPSLHAAPGPCNGGAVPNGVPPPLTNGFLQPQCRNSPSEGSSEGSSHSDDPSFCGFAASCPRICDGLPPPPEKRAPRRRRPKPGCTVVDLLSVPRRGKSTLLPLPSIQDLMSRKTGQRSGAFGVNPALSGPV
ncbi:SUN domain-containing ossification factor-like isoform X2 [Antennarius striatus]|uniref:SUN domain-containing ossification factor-like isoform X2 n=1 Tax=Antennarius striatus TaxID=241820 RepID=UPI0035AE0380